MSVNRFADALDALAAAGWDEDACYVAECVLSPEELIAFVESRSKAASPTRPRRDVRDLLARRLVRLGRWKEARPYFSPAKQQVLDRYIIAIRTGHDAKNRTDDERADAFWQAAQIAHDHGTELFGHETPPQDSGSYYPADVVKARLTAKVSLAAPTADEQARAKAMATREYSYVTSLKTAADHAWAAAALLPDESDQTARILCLGGGWIRYRDRDRGGKFFRALIDRCGTTAIGRTAARLNRLPDLP